MGGGETVVLCAPSGGSSPHLAKESLPISCFFHQVLTPNLSRLWGGHTYASLALAAAVFGLIKSNTEVKSIVSDHCPLPASPHTPFLSTTQARSLLVARNAAVRLAAADGARGACSINRQASVLKRSDPSAIGDGQLPPGLPPAAAQSRQKQPQQRCRFKHDNRVLGPQHGRSYVAVQSLPRVECKWVRRMRTPGAFQSHHHHIILFPSATCKH